MYFHNDIEVDPIEADPINKSLKKDNFLIQANGRYVVTTNEKSAK